jgi:hypothetical protein
MIEGITPKVRHLCLPLLTLTIAQLATVADALAWGDVGHRVICQIAYLELTPAVRAKVDALIALDPKFRTFAQSCTWPDSFPAVRPPEHFLNVPRTAQSVDPANVCPTADRCVASAILNDARDLALSQDAGDSLRLLKSLGHWVGDIHQPLHVSFEDDKGANFIAVTGSCGFSLHLVWDICIIETKIGLDEVPLAAELRSEISDGDRAAWGTPDAGAPAVAAWASESLAIATQPSVQYCYRRGDACWYALNERQFSAARRSVEITGRYLEEHAPIVRDRLKRAGIRLAAILNSVFSNAAPMTSQ